MNPIAGFGGPLAMHGTDALAPERFDEAVRAGRAARRLLQALDRFGDAAVMADFVAAPGVLGADHLAASGIPHRILHGTVGRPTTRRDTIDAARGLVADGVDVLVFSGGDGTAADLAEALGTAVPVIGIPSGVKMHSEVFARSPESAGRLLADVLAGDAVSELAEVLDVGADGASGVVAMLLAPRSREVLQGAKTSARGGSASAQSRTIARELVASADNDVTWIIGPGNTTSAVADELGFAATLRGVDVLHPTGELELDVTEERLHQITCAAGNPRLVLGVVGGQGFLLGRGNQQISPRVIESVGATRVEIVATSQKVGGLFPPVLYVDTEEPVGLLGYRRVRIGARQSTVMKVSAA
ncbi:MAG: NAD(+)/NADH kinase [Pseudolysinimonas sp.]